MANSVEYVVEQQGSRRTNGLRVHFIHTWVLVQEFELRYHNKETLVFTIGPYYGNLK